MHVGIVCEGPTDYVVLREVCRAVLAGKGHRYTLLQPDKDALMQKDPAAFGSGWQGVRAFLQQTGVTLVASVHDVLVVHLDADIRHLHAVKAHLGRETTEDELSLLCDHIKSWFPGPLPAKLVIVIPREATEAWLVAAHTNLHDVEAIARPADALRDAGLIGGVAGNPQKQPLIFEKLAADLAVLVRNKRRLAEVPELGRFLGKLNARVKATKKGTQATP
jgi:hypothetical protein